MNQAPAGLIESTKALIADKHEKAEIIEEIEIKRPLSATAFNGHICSLPIGEKMRRGNRWICMHCEQGWRVAYYWNRIKADWIPYWKMYGKDDFSTIQL